MNDTCIKITLNWVSRVSQAPVKCESKLPQQKCDGKEEQQGFIRALPSTANARELPIA